MSDKSILKSTGIMTIATLLSRASGLLRTWAMAFALGNTLLTSAYQVANNMPNFIFELVAGGILGAAFLPVYLLQREKEGKEEGDRFASNILNILLVLLGILSILATVFAPQVISTQTFTVSSDSEVFETAVIFFRIFAIQIMFYGLGGVITGVLNANRVYGIPALAPAFNNLVVIISMFAYVPLSALDPYLALIVLGIGTTLGVVVQFAIQLPTLVKIGFSYTPRINLRDPALKEVLRIALPTLIYIVGTLVAFSCRNAFSLETGDDGPSTILYAWMWYQLPYGVIAVSISTAFLTEMSDAVARSDLSSLRDYVKKGLRTTLFLIIPLAGLMIVLASPIIQIFRAGAFNQEDVVYVSSILAVWVVSLPFYAGLMYLYRVFAALRQFMTFAVVSCILCVLQVGLYAILCQPEMLGLIGIPVADIVYYGLMFATMAFILHRRIGSFEMVPIIVLCLKVLASTAVGAAVVYGILQLIPLQPSILTGLLEIIVCGSIGLAITFGLCKLLRVPELDWIGENFGRILKRRSKDRTPAELDSGSETMLIEPEASELPEPFELSDLSDSEELFFTPELPHGKHVRWDDQAFFEDDDDDDYDIDLTWNKQPKHAARSKASVPHNDPPEEFLDPGSTGAIIARARHIKP